MEYFNQEVERVATENPGLLDVTEIVDKNVSKMSSSKQSCHDSKLEEDKDE